MDPIRVYSDIIKQIMAKYAQLKPYHANIRLDILFDDFNHRYALMQGWVSSRQPNLRGYNLNELILLVRSHFDYHKAISPKVRPWRPHLFSIQANLG